MYLILHYINTLVLSNRFIKFQNYVCVYKVNVCGVYYLYI